MPFSGLRRWIRSSAKPRSHSYRRSILAPRPRVELLEDRELLATAIWTGASTGNSNWSTAANWAGNTAPNSGDDLVFPSGAARLANVDDISGGDFHSIQFTGSGYSISSSVFTLLVDSG